MSKKSAWHQNKKPVMTEFGLTKSEMNAHVRKYRNLIKVGLAIIPFCETANAWMLPAGPRQQNRYVRDYETAFAYAVRINDILQHYPHLAMRLEHSTRRVAA